MSSAAYAAACIAMVPGCHDHAGADGGGTDGGTAGDGSGDGSGSGDGTADGTAGSDGGLPDDIEPAPGGLRRLLATEYVRSIEVMLGSAAADAAVPPDDQAQGGWDAIGNTILSLASDPVSQYEVSASAVADAVIADPSQLAQTAPCVMGAQDDQCYSDVATDFGRFAWRRDVTEEERTALVALGQQGKSFGNGDFLTGLKYELMAILQAPSFLYVAEIGEPDDASGYRMLTGRELATRMSFFILGRTPDLALLDAGDNGELDNEDGIRNWAQTLIASAEARVATENFFDEYLRLRNLPTVAKNATIFPLFTESLASAMRQETLLLVNDIVWQTDGDIRQLFNADYTFINADLAELYGMTPPSGPGFVQVNWPAEQGRAGFTSQGSFLSTQSGPLRTSPTVRGKFVQIMLLCNDIPPPPSDVVPTLPDPQPGETLRQLLEQHMKDPACATCHAMTDPVGFAFENFDGIGSYRTQDNGSPIDSSGNVDGIGNWSTAAELGNILAEHDNTPTCLISNVIEGHLGFEVTPGLAPGIDALQTSFEDSGYSLQSLMVELTASPIFRFVDEPK